MLTLIGISKAVNDCIEAALAGTAFVGVPLLATDIAEPIIRPSIKVMLDSGQNGLFNASSREKTLTFRIHFFAESEYKYRLDNLKMQEIIEGAFLHGLTADGAYVPIDSVETTIADTVLVCTIEIYAIELLPDTGASEQIEEIIFKEALHD